MLLENLFHYVKLALYPHTQNIYQIHEVGIYSIPLKVSQYTGRNHTDQNQGCGTGRLYRCHHTQDIHHYHHNEDMYSLNIAPPFS